MRLTFLLFASIMGAFAQGTNMDGQVFLFATRSATNYVTLKQDVTTLTGFTACVRAFTELTAGFSYLSCNSPSQDNNLLLFHRNSKENPYAVHVGGPETPFRSTSSPPLDRYHICGTWDSFTGVVQMFLNGKPLARKVMKKGYSIQGPLKCILGQEQDSFGGKFDINQSFVGEIDNVHVWDYVLSPADIHQAFMNNKHLNGNVISWWNLWYDITGDVLVEPVQQSHCDNQACCESSPRCKTN
ncbi:mucosal pentraxin-like [Pleurodeles waltl]|uniref:mucosal pentraxin-like n=1 Tax=Pleurodeles waltl TaxID=8319 RepID=UPI00370991F7